MCFLPPLSLLSLSEKKRSPQIGTEASLGNIDLETLPVTYQATEHLFSVAGKTPGQVSLARSNEWEWVVTHVNEVELKKPFPFCTSGVHRVYTILGEPEPPWNNTYGSPQNAWVSALDFACDWASGSSSEANAVSQITTSAYTKFGKTYNGFISHTFANICLLTDLLADSDVDCRDMSAVVFLFTRLIGGTTVRICRVNGFFEYKKLRPIGLTSAWETGTWGFHQFGWYDGKVYDACVMLNETNPYIPVNDDLNTNYKSNVWSSGDWIPLLPFELVNFQ